MHTPREGAPHTRGRAALPLARSRRRTQEEAVRVDHPRSGERLGDPLRRRTRPAARVLARALACTRAHARREEGRRDGLGHGGERRHGHAEPLEPLDGHVDLSGRALIPGHVHEGHRRVGRRDGLVDARHARYLHAEAAQAQREGARPAPRRWQPRRRGGDERAAGGRPHGEEGQPHPAFAPRDLGERARHGGRVGRAPAAGALPVAARNGHHREPARERCARPRGLLGQVGARNKDVARTVRAAVGDEHHGGGAERQGGRPACAEERQRGERVWLCVCPCVGAWVRARARPHCTRTIPRAIVCVRTGTGENARNRRNAARASATTGR